MGVLATPLWVLFSGIGNTKNKHGLAEPPTAVLGPYFGWYTRRGILMGFVSLGYDRTILKKIFAILFMIIKTLCVMWFMCFVFPKSLQMDLPVQKSLVLYDIVREMGALKRYTKYRIVRVRKGSICNLTKMRVELREEE
jgi:hypothetical protein